MTHVHKGDIVFSATAVARVPLNRRGRTKHPAATTRAGARVIERCIITIDALPTVATRGRFLPDLDHVGPIAAKAMSSRQKIVSINQGTTAATQESPRRCAKNRNLNGTTHIKLG